MIGRYDSCHWTEEYNWPQKYVLTKLKPVSLSTKSNAKVSNCSFLAKTQYFNLNPDFFNLKYLRADSDWMWITLEEEQKLVFDRTEQLWLYTQAVQGKIDMLITPALVILAEYSALYADLRNYQRIHKNIIFASRLYVGSFMGIIPQTYLVGGMDNWL